MLFLFERSAIARQFLVSPTSATSLVCVGVGGGGEVKPRLLISLELCHPWRRQRWLFLGDDLQDLDIALQPGSNIRRK